MAIPYGSIMASLRQRQVDIYNQKEQEKQRKRAQTQQLIQLGAMAVGAAMGGIPALGVAGAGGMGGVLTGAGIGQAAGGLLGGAATGSLDTMGAVSGGLGLATGIHAMGQRQGMHDDRMGQADARTAIAATNAGFRPLDSMPQAYDANLENQIGIGGQQWAGPSQFGEAFTPPADLGGLPMSGARVTVGEDGKPRYSYSYAPEKSTGSSMAGGEWSGTSFNELPPVRQRSALADADTLAPMVTRGADGRTQVVQYGEPGWEEAYIQKHHVDPREVFALTGDPERRMTERQGTGLFGTGLLPRTHREEEVIRPRTRRGEEAAGRGPGY